MIHKASKILAYVAKHRRPFPLETDSDTDNDLMGGLVWNELEWVSLTKAEYARWQNVKPPQISRWIAAGLPTQSDGRIVPAQAQRWLEAHRPEWIEERHSRFMRRLEEMRGGANEE